MAIRGRFAPSPSGELHLGGARTALCAWLAARTARGGFVLRMDDLDPARSMPAFAAGLLEDLAWLGLDWDEGPDRGGPHAPYAQSQRGDLYNDALARLAERGLTYECFCSRAEIARAAQAPHGPGDDGPRYPGTCAALDEAARDERRRAGRPAALRLRVSPAAVELTDGLFGAVRADVAAEVGDFVVRRADGVASYQLATAVDDAAMGITQVVRGADLLPSTARQILILRALGLEVPRYAHVPLVLGPDGARLAKRHGAVSIRALREAGLAAPDVVGGLAATLGLAPPGARATAAELVGRFDLARLPREPTRIDPAVWIR